MRPNKITMPQVRDQIVQFTGGVNESETQLELKPGELIACQNYMEADGPAKGYVSLKGFERYDGTTLASTVDVPILRDYGLLNDDTVILLESDGTLGFTDLASSQTFTGTSVTEPETFSFYPKYKDTSFFVNNHVGGLSMSDALGFIDPIWDDFTVELRFKAHASLDTTVDSTLINKTGLFKVYCDTDGTDLRFAFSISDIAPSTTTVITSKKVVPGGEYHVVLTSKAVAGTRTTRLLVNGETLIENGTFDVAEITGTDDLVSNTNALTVGSTVPAADTDSTYGYFDAIRIDIGSYRYFGHYDIPTLPYSDPGYSTINYDDRSRELERATIKPPSLAFQPSGIAYFSEDHKIYVKAGNKVYNDSASGWVQNTSITPNAPESATYTSEIMRTGGTLKGADYRIDGFDSGSSVLILVDGVSLPRIWDGSVCTVLTDTAILEMADAGQYPSFTMVWANRVVLGYTSGQLLMSASFSPTDFSGGFGAGVVLGDELVGFTEGPEDTMICFMRNSIKVFYSRIEASADFTMTSKVFSRSSGAIEGTIQRALSDIVYADDRGVLSFQATDKYGDFESVALTKKVNKTFQSKKLTITCSMIDKESNQYRLFFEDGSGIIFTFDAEGKLAGATFCKYQIPVREVVTGEDASGNIVKYFVSSTNYVYKMDSGTSFDGVDIPVAIETSFHSYGGARYWKRFRKVIFEIDADDYHLWFNYKVNYDYKENFINNSQDTSLSLFDTMSSSSLWAKGDWGSFFWRSKSLVERPGINISGYGTNMSLAMNHSSRYLNQHILHNMIVDYSVNNRKRR